MNEKKILVWSYFLFFINFLVFIISIFHLIHYFNSSNYLSEEEITAYHEAGHTLIALAHPDFCDVSYTTIKPSSKMLGHTKIKYKQNNPYLNNLILLGGTSAEYLLAEQNKMDKTKVGRGSLDDYLQFNKNLLNSGIKKSFNLFLKESRDKSKEIIKKNKKILEQIVKQLISQKHLNKIELQQILEKNGPIKK